LKKGQKLQIWPQKSQTGNPVGQFSRGKETTKQWNYYETKALFTLFHKRLGKVRHVQPDV